MIHISVYKSGGVDVEFDGEHFGKKELLRANKIMRLEYRNKVRLHRQKQKLKNSQVELVIPKVVEKEVKPKTILVNGKEITLK
jgi:hypothetical protein